MHSESQISLHEIGPPFSSSGGAMIHRLCTDYFILTIVLLQDRQSPCIRPLRPVDQSLHDAEHDVAFWKQLVFLA